MKKILCPIFFLFMTEKDSENLAITMQNSSSIAEAFTPKHHHVLFEEFVIAKKFQSVVKSVFSLVFASGSFCTGGRKTCMCRSIAIFDAEVGAVL